MFDVYEAGHSKARVSGIPRGMGGGKIREVRDGGTHKTHIDSALVYSKPITMSL